MIATPTVEHDPTMLIPAGEIWRIPVATYHDMIEAGIFTTEHQIELLEGRLTEKMPKKPPHAGINSLLAMIVGQMILPDWIVRSQEPITTEDSEPEPDLVVARGPHQTYFERHPSSDDIALVIEVSDATLYRDRNLKKRIYARAGIGEYWIVDVAGRTVEVYKYPLTTGDYAQKQTFGEHDTLSIVLDGVEIGRIQPSTFFPS